MDRRTKWIAGGAAAMIGAAVVAGVSMAAGAADNRGDQPLTGTVLEHGAAAALEHTGGGTVIESEIGDEGAAYGVEIRRPDGRIVEVALDERFKVVGDSTDDVGASDNNGPHDD